MASILDALSSGIDPVSLGRAVKSSAGVIVLTDRPEILVTGLPLPTYEVNLP